MSSLSHTSTAVATLLEELSALLPHELVEWFASTS